MLLSIHKVQRENRRKFQIKAVVILIKKTQTKKKLLLLQVVTGILRLHK